VKTKRQELAGDVDAGKHGLAIWCVLLDALVDLRMNTLGPMKRVAERRGEGKDESWR